MRRLPLIAVLALPLVLAACAGQQSRKDIPRISDVSNISDCQVLKITPERQTRSAVVNPLISVVYTTPVPGGCDRLVLKDDAGAVVPTRTVSAAVQAKPGGGLVGSITIEPLADLRPSTAYGAFLDGRSASTFATGMERRGHLLKADDVTVNFPSLPSASRIPRDRINALADAFIAAQLKAHDIPGAVEPVLRPLLRAELPRIAHPDARYDAQVKRVVYRSTDAAGAPVSLSGLLVFPVAAADGPAIDLAGLPLVRGQHPTVVDGAPAPSSGADLMLLPGLWAAGKGHVYFVPDLIGLGASAALPQAFVIGKDTSAHTEDMLTAVREYFLQVHRAPLGQDLRVIGLSQGAFSAMAALPALSRLSTVRAVYGAAGPYDIHRTLDGALRAAAGRQRDAYATDANLARLPDYLRPTLDALVAYQGFSYDRKAVFDDQGAPLPSFLADYVNGKYDLLATHLTVNSLPEASLRYDVPMAKVALYRYSKDTLLASRNTDDMLALLQGQRPRVASAMLGDCREESLVVREILKHARSVSTPHLLCFPFAVDDFLGEL